MRGLRIIRGHVGENPEEEEQNAQQASQRTLVELHRLHDIGLKIEFIFN